MTITCASLYAEMTAASLLVSFPDPSHALEVRNVGKGSGDLVVLNQQSCDYHVRQLIRRNDRGIPVSLVPRPLPPGKGSGDFRQVFLVAWADWNVKCHVSKYIHESLIACIM